MQLKKPIEDKLLKLIIETYFFPLFEQNDYLFRKSKNDFIKKDNPIIRNVEYFKDFIFLKKMVDKDIVEVYIKLTFSLTDLKFQSWYSKITDKPNYKFKHILFDKIVVLNISNLDLYRMVTNESPKEDFDANYFANEMLYHTSDGNIENNMISFDNFKDILLGLFDKSSRIKNIEGIFNDSENKAKMEYFSILVYTNKTERLKENTDKHFEHLVNGLNSGNERYVNYIENFIRLTKKITGIEYEFPKKNSG